MALKKIIKEKNEKECSIKLIVWGTKGECNSIKNQFHNQVFNWTERPMRSKTPNLTHQISGIYSIKNTDSSCNIEELEKLINDLVNDGWKPNLSETILN